VRTIYKYPIDTLDQFTVRMPKGAQVVHVDMQMGSAQMWAMVDTEQSDVPRKFALRGTGHDCEDMPVSAHVGSFQMHGGRLVFHLFDLGEA
jgi:hypothetical protein